MTESAEKRKIRRIVMVAGGVETLEYFAIQMAERFRELGYSVFFRVCEKASQICAHRGDCACDV